MNISIRFLLFVLINLSIGISAYSQSRIYVNEYLNIGVGARGLGMSGAQAATTNDVYSGYWNPAGLMHIESDVEGGLMHAEYFAGIFKYDYGGIAVPIQNKKRFLGLSFIRFATDNIPYTLDYVQPDGTFDESKLKGFSAGDYAVLLSYAQNVQLFKNNPEIKTSFGANAKIIYRHVGSMANAWGFGIDLGLQAQYKQWRFGAMLKDITTTYTSWSFHLTEAEKKKFGETGNEIPIKSSEIMLPRINLGVGYQFMKPESAIQIGAELGFDVTTDGKRATLISSKPFSIDPKLGLEASYKNVVFLRAGVGNFYQALDDTDTTNQSKYTVFQPAIGVGFKVKSFAIDYSFTSLNVQNNPLYSHIVSLRITLSKPKPVEGMPNKTNKMPPPEEKYPVKIEK